MMNKKIKNVCDTEIEILRFHHHKTLIILKDLDIDNIGVFCMAASGEKNYQNFIGYKDDHEYKIKSLCIMLPKKSTYVTNFDGKTK